jgi:4-aminobutyrate aminotransferase-like enzyme/Ser/Thr protein kinase RdoA (MazF antagonist)
VLTGATPRLSEADAVEIGAALFGVRVSAARDLGSERDRTFRLGERAILKVSNAAEDPAVLDMEAAVALHVTAVDPGLRVALPWRSDDPGPARAGDAPAALRARWGEHWVRLYDVLPGSSRIEATDLSDAALTAWGETTARLGQALRAFTHPCATRVMPWDVQHALRGRELLADLPDAQARAAVERVLDEFERSVQPVWPLLRAQVAHTDLTVDNTLTDEHGFITGVIDFGDMSHTALITDLASVLDSVCGGREGAELLRAARLVIDGYQRRVLLEDLELGALGVAWAARAALTVAISSWRVAHGLEDQAWAERYNATALRTLASLEDLGWDGLARALGAEGPRAPDPSLAARRAAAFGPAIDPLFYAEPIEVRAAHGVWIEDTAGRRFLDAYNNVPCVGHAHPRVTAAIARQSRRVNTHTRYLHPSAIELAERLTATLPEPLDTVLLVNSGSEANDLAWRMATAVTGRRGGLCTRFAYHGITEAIAALSPEGWFGAPAPEHVETWDPWADASALTAAVERMRHAPAAAIFDGIITSDGIADLAPAYVQELVRRTHAAGALWIADEVQSGHGRTGAMWSIDRAGIVPDFVTLGKPMGNGHPVAAVITRREITDQLVGHTTLFSTFGGNPVSAAAALAVLDVIEDERVLERVQRTGAALRTALTAVGAGAVRGVGLAWGVELESAERARAVRDRMRALGVLVGTTGRHGNVLKLRPPLALEERHVPQLADALERAS